MNRFALLLLENVRTTSEMNLYVAVNLHTSQEARQAGAYLCCQYSSMKQPEVFTLPLRWAGLTPALNLPRSVPIHSLAERGNGRVKCLAQEHNTMSPARAQTRTAGFGGSGTNH